MNRARLRAGAWVLVLTAVGAASGIVASKLLWGYFLAPPTAQPPPGVQPMALSVVWLRPEIVVRSHDERDSLIRTELDACRRGSEDCQHGRILQATGAERWLEVVGLGEERVARDLANAYSFHPAPFFLRGGHGTAVVAEYGGGKCRGVIVTFNSEELHADTHGFVEVVMEDCGPKYSATLRASNLYYYDVAGIEFATPAFLAVTGGLLLNLAAGLVCLVLFLVRRAGCSMPKR